MIISMNVPMLANLSSTQKDAISGCSVEEAMHVLGGRWCLLIVSYRVDGPKRFSELRRMIPGISQRMLTLDLRTLEDANFVQRTVYPTIPVKVECALTEVENVWKRLSVAVQEFGLWLKARCCLTL
ncbi:winged helix-turn-helix transcriptional regulator [Agrobacterium vitis]|uniref:winged helix-turn-helix transcriptional regulator n=1 Tax=Agrobacterium vitis TaxID=373 RepID=UPI003D2E102D